MWLECFEPRDCFVEDNAADEEPQRVSKRRSTIVSRRAPPLYLAVRQSLRFQQRRRVSTSQADTVDLPTSMSYAAASSILEPGGQSRL
jgi:hypothetical protein